METCKDNYCVYMHINKINNKVYIGQTCQDIKRRWRDGGSGYLVKRNGKYTQPLFARAILKYGWNNFEHIVWAEGLIKEEANKSERLLIAIWDTRNPKHGYNIRFGGDNHKLTEETKKKISDAKKGKYAGGKSPMYGKHLSEETKEKISQANRGKKIPEEVKKKISEANKGRTSPNKGKQLTEMEKKKIRDSSTFKKQVLCIETEIVYNSTREAEEETGIAHSGISRSCNGIQKTAGGFHWEYYEKYFMAV